MVKMRAIVFDVERRAVRFAKVKDLGPYAGKSKKVIPAGNPGTVIPRGKPATGETGKLQELKKFEEGSNVLEFEAKGRVVAHDGAANLIKADSMWMTSKRKPRRYLLLEEGSPRPLTVDENGFHPMPMSDDELYLAIKTRQTIAFHRGGMSWQLIAIILLGLVDFVLVVALATGK